MKPGMTDTERARAIVSEYQDYCEKRLLPYDYDALTDYIAQALHETREAAARVCCEAADRSDIGAVASALRGAADSIRAGGG